MPLQQLHGHVTIVLPNHLHGNAAVSDRLGVSKVRQVIDIHCVHRVPDVIQSKLPLATLTLYTALSCSRQEELQG